jgi:hypothetical protein
MNLNGNLFWLVIVFILIVFSFIAPHIIANYFESDFIGKGDAGTVVGGIMSPFVAIAGVVVTYLAFKMQFIANKDQRENFKKELENQRIEFRKSQIENQFYEMLRLYKENLNEVSITLKIKSEEEMIDEETVLGREVFTFFLKEIEHALVYTNKELPIIKRVKVAYQLFFLGASSYKQLLGEEKFNKLVPYLKEIYEFNSHINENNVLRYKILKG